MRPELTVFRSRLIFAFIFIQFWFSGFHCFATKKKKPVGSIACGNAKFLCLHLNTLSISIALYFPFHHPLLIPPIQFQYWQNYWTKPLHNIERSQRLISKQSITRIPENCHSCKNTSFHIRLRRFCFFEESWTEEKKNHFLFRLI